MARFHKLNRTSVIVFYALGVFATTVRAARRLICYTSRRSFHYRYNSFNHQR